ncbi:MAG: S26 family signal peptidase, partial [Atopobiaceae bacterium]|nr:S26 family signal peptidase [Atopobiaceae bacterium]
MDQRGYSLLVRRMTQTVRGTTRMDEQNEEIEAEERPTRGQVALDWGLTIAIPLAVGLLIHFFVLEAFIVPSGSMLNTVQLNDRLWSEKVSYRFRAPERGEVVLFDSPSEEG